jgi:hypothetical protein
MAVVTRLGTLVSNYEAVPRILSSGYLAGGNDTVAVATVGAVSTDSIASVYKFGFVPSGVRIEDIQMMCDATTAGAWSLGIILNDNQGLNMGGPGASVQTWSSTAAYVPGQVVQYNGVIYYCILASTNNAPPNGTYWTVGGAVNAPAGAVAIPNNGQIFGSAISTASAVSNWKSVYSPSIGAVGFAAANVGLRVWELAGFSQDPFYEFLLAMTATTAPTATGNISLQYSWVR